MGKRKGCFDCSRRRIICDMTEPHCVKCAKRGIVCSGMGIRYRFSPGIASRGRFKDRQIPVLDASEARGSGNREALSRRSGSVSLVNPNFVQKTTRSPSTVQAKFASIGPVDHNVACHENDDERLMYLQRLLPEIQILDGRTHMLFTHFSAFVASALVPLDSKFNGYRRILLPLAHEDPEVRRAVCLVSALHLSSKVPELREAANAARLASIFGLKRYVREHDRSEVLSVSNWAVIILLLAGEMIRGGSDFSYLLKMLMSLVEARGSHDADSDVHSFLIQETKMIGLFGRPFLGESEGIQALSRGVESYRDFISHATRYDGNCSHQISVSLLIAAVSFATDIYLRRALSQPAFPSSTYDWASHYHYPSSTLPSSPSISLQHLISLVSGIYAHTPGSHSLVWVYFIGAAESSTEEDRNFFTTKLEELYRTIGFENIMIGVGNLKELWASGERQGKGGERIRWTERLPRVESLVM
uniref:Zn(2)-C6 fungal-type domain-containing protein n=1 Tax=Coccidioides posadasii RMSCC 3488 TaxID=454284 RepID=A0A0J6FPV4_COCPO|nr:hypothetical protein CPAG_07311 [Coccidioides posadasii RMSCC 3488]